MGLIRLVLCAVPALLLLTSKQFVKAVSYIAVFSVFYAVQVYVLPHLTGILNFLVLFTTCLLYTSTLDCQKKFRNFWGSTWAIRRMNDKLCLEHGLSIVENPKPSREHYGTWLGNKKQPSFQEQIRIAIAVSYTHLDVYKRQPEVLSAFMTWRKSWQKVSSL